ncbi:MAG: response regulator [Ignavibacteria bacterium]|jgi:two-component system response regulator|nr:response regulator [Ignavibacteria bacterium]MDH7528624.1 response regulator [Ignavibacteria bacterium]
MNNYKILIVDDNPLVVKMHLHYLKRAGLDAETTSNGKEAKAKIAEKTYDLVILDLMMPEVSGFDVLKTIRANPKNDRTKVIVASALNDKEVVELCFQLGANYFVTSPVSYQSLMEKVKDALGLKGV